MRNRHLQIILILASAFAWQLSAQDQAKTVLDEVSTELSSYSTIQADFSLTLVNIEADIEDTFEGKLIMEGQKFRLSMMGMLVFCDGSKIWTYIEDLNEVSISDPDESDFFDPTQIFTLYQKDFKLETISVTGSIHEIKLTPSKPDQEYTHIILTLDKTKKRILSAEYFGKDENIYKIKITNTIANIPLDTRFFIFDPENYPGVTVNDMR